eukprot:CAMPEP_0185731234 /NCGR_PEP_ID=MMETSP1171-20130828/12306_1 /TAXON_ID=374046 /ORGANISM="Helicotheca tamensis, Strain CCMP826" /LENGTH=214 /DNA_ID=CAMNT_0028400459 /DNA_START=163 /DNA_END=807 /DNA_ORIENTATION=+
MVKKQKWKKLRCALGKIDKEERTILCNILLMGNFLHQLCHEYAPVDIVRTVIELLPNAISSLDSDYRTPLHIAARSRCPANLINVLISAYPSAASVRDIKGRTPLILACDSGSDILGCTVVGPQADVVQALVTAAPEAIYAVDSRGKTALNYAVENLSDEDVLTVLVRATRENQQLKKKTFQVVVFENELRHVPGEIKAEERSFGCDDISLLSR